ncbi:MAG: signal recognition particle protein, partial [Actinobacteria bacterium]|nr:signal recognition particle protein [Actinomycetota bacterium]
MFESLSERFSSAFATLRGKGRISESDIEAICDEIRLALLDGDVALTVVNGFINRIKQRSLAALPEIRKSTNQSQEIYSIVNAELVEILGGPARRIRFAKNP